MTESKAGRAIPDALLERHRLGELSAEIADDVRRRVAEDPSASERLTQLERSDAEILAGTPAKEFAARVRARAAEAGWTAATSSDGRSFGTGRMLLAASLTVAVGLGIGGSMYRAGGESGDRPKGAPAEVVLFRRIPGDGIERLTAASSARAGDVVQLAYRATEDGYGAIVSIDGRGVVTRHFPVSGDAAAPLRIGGTVPLEAAFRLDDAPAHERFYLVTSRGPFSIDGVIAAVRAGVGAATVAPARLPLDPSFGQASFLLKKE